MFFRKFCIVPQGALRYPKSSCSSCFSLHISTRFRLCLFNAVPAVSWWSNNYPLTSSPFTFDSLLHWNVSWLHNRNNTDALNLHVFLPTGMSLVKHLDPMDSLWNSKGQLVILKERISIPKEIILYQESNILRTPNLHFLHPSCHEKEAKYLLPWRSNKYSYDTRNFWRIL